MGKVRTNKTFLRRCAACGQREDDGHSLAVHYNCLTCIACKSFFYRSGKQLRAAGVQDADMASRKVYERKLDNHARYTKCLAAGMDPVLVLDPSKRAANRTHSRSRRRAPRRSASTKRAQPSRDFVLPNHLISADVPSLVSALEEATSETGSEEFLSSLARFLDKKLKSRHANAPPVRRAAGSSPASPTVTADHVSADYDMPWGVPAAPSDTFTSEQDSSIFAAPAVPDATLCDPLFQLLMGNTVSHDVVGDAQPANTLTPFNADASVSCMNA